MNDPLDDRIRKIVRLIGESGPEPPPPPSEAFRAKATGQKLGGSKLVAGSVTGFLVVAAVAGVILVFRGTNNRVAVPSVTTATSASSVGVPVWHQTYEYIQSTDLACDEGASTESGEFNKMTIEVWADLQERRFRQRSTYPDGSTRDVIALGHPSLPRESYERGEPKGTVYECLAYGTVLNDPTATISVLFFNSPIEEPGAMGYAELGSQLRGEHTDSRGRPADVYQEVISGSIDASGSEINQVTEWFVEPEADSLLEVTMRQTADEVLVFSWTTTLIKQEDSTVDEAFFDTDGYTLSWEASDYGPGPAVEAEPTEPSTTLGPEWIWPEVPDPSGPEVVGRRFAAEVLRWPAAIVTPDPQAAPDGPTMVTLDDGAGLTVPILTFPGPDGWAAIQIGNGGTSLGVGAEAVANISVMVPELAVSATVLIGTADATLAWMADVSPESQGIIVPGVVVDDIRTVLILYSNDDGQVIDATGGQFYAP